MTHNDDELETIVALGEDEQMNLLNKILLAHGATKQESISVLSNEELGAIFEGVADLTELYSALFNDVAPHLTGIRNDFVDALLIEIGVKQHRAAASKKTTKGNESATRLDKPRPKRSKKGTAPNISTPATPPPAGTSEIPVSANSEIPVSVESANFFAEIDSLGKATSEPPPSVDPEEDSRATQLKVARGPHGIALPTNPEFDDKPTAAGVTLARATRAPLATPSSAVTVAPPAAPTNTKSDMPTTPDGTATPTAGVLAVAVAVNAPSTPSQPIPPVSIRVDGGTGTAPTSLQGEPTAPIPIPPPPPKETAPPAANGRPLPVPKPPKKQHSDIPLLQDMSPEAIEAVRLYEGAGAVAQPPAVEPRMFPSPPPDPPAAAPEPSGGSLSEAERQRYAAEAMADRASRNGSPPPEKKPEAKKEETKAKAETSAKKKPAKRDLLGWILPTLFAVAIGAGVVGTIHIATKPRAPSVARVKPTNEILAEISKAWGNGSGTVTCWVAEWTQSPPAANSNAPWLDCRGDKEQCDNECCDVSECVAVVTK